jgi:hypothetical protein
VGRAEPVLVTEFAAGQTVVQPGRHREVRVAPMPDVPLAIPSLD